MGKEARGDKDGRIPINFSYFFKKSLMNAG
jgi:hypothetical protein